MTFIDGWRRSLIRPVATLVAAIAVSASHVDTRATAITPSPPGWAYPVNAPNLPGRKAGQARVSVPGSMVSLFPAQLVDLFSAPDWHPADHPVMPDVVARGRRPEVQACGFCHLPDGAGRPENASLAGLPAAYIEQQVREFSTGARRTSVPSRVPAMLMAKLASLATDEEVKTAAVYFSRLTPRNQIHVVETRTVPRTHVEGWIRVVDRDARWEPIGQRIIEVPVDLQNFEHRDAYARYIAYVPLGSVAAGKVLVNSGPPNRPLACAACHGTDLKGAGKIPGVAGRSPSYIVRQLFDIQSGLRVGAQVAPMAEVANQLHIEEMEQIAAYLATLN